MSNKYLIIYLGALTVAIVASFLESISYFGFVAKHFIFPAYIWYFFSLICALFITTKYRIVIQTLRLISIVSTILYVILAVLEHLAYPNFVYASFHLNLQAMQVFVLLSSFHWFCHLYGQSDRLLKLGKSLLIASLIITAAKGLGLGIAHLAKGIAGAVLDPFATYEDKLVKAYGGFYPAMRLVTQLTPDNALILIPPQANPWEVEGNAPMVTYYLYPRRVENLGDLVPETDRPVYALIAHGSWPKTGETDYGWPKIKIPAGRIWRFDSIPRQAEELKRGYDPATDSWDWGLIEVKP